MQKSRPIACSAWNELQKKVFFLCKECNRPTVAEWFMKSYSQFISMEEMRIKLNTKPELSIYVPKSIDVIVPGTIEIQTSVHSPLEHLQMSSVY